MKYWYGTAGILPKVDIRKQQTHKTTPITVRYLRIITHPLVAFSGVLVLGVLAIIIVAGVYVPLLQEYTNGCVDVDHTTNGTFFTNNAYSIAFNMAALESNRNLAKGLDQYDIERAELCGEAQQEARYTFAAQEKEFESLKVSILPDLELLDLMDQCVDHSVFHPVGGISYPTPETGIKGCDIGSFESFQLKPLSLDCSTLPACSPSCMKRLDTSSLKQQTHRAGCYTELYLHAGFLKSVSVVAVVISWTLFRKLFMSGILRIYWRKTSPELLVFTGSCSNDGEVADDTEEQLRVEVERSITSFERKGYFMIALAIVCNIPYLGLLHFVRHILTNGRLIL